MQIICPKCQFTKELNLDKIPATAEVATCPKCSNKFSFRTINKSAEQAADLQPVAPQDQIEPHAADLPQPPTGDETSAPDLPPPSPGSHKPTIPTIPPFELGEKKTEGFWERIESMGSEKKDAYEERAASFGRRAGDISSSQEQFGPESEIPWERLDKYGFFQGFFQTIRPAMFNPTLFFQNMPVGGGTIKPLTFCLLIAELQAIVQFLLVLVGGGAAESAGMGGFFLGFGSFFILLLYPIFYAMALYLSTGLNHLFLMLFQSASRGFEGTFRAVCYGSAPLILSLIPFIGPVIGGIWALVVTVIAYKCVHQSTYPRVTASILAPIFLVMLLAVLAVFVVGMFESS